MTENSPSRIIKLGQTDGFRYLGFQPPLSPEELASLPLPAVKVGRTRHAFPTSSVETFPNETMDIGFSSLAFEGQPGSFEAYAQRVAQHLGECALDTEVRSIGPGSVIAQANGAPAEW